MKPLRLQCHRPDAAAILLVDHIMNVLLQLVVGALVGVLVGITGTGGAFVIPALIYVFRMDSIST